MSLLLIIVVLIVLFGGGGYYGYRRWGAPGASGILGLVVTVLVVTWLLGFLRLH